MKYLPREHPKRRHAKAAGHMRQHMHQGTQVFARREHRNVFARERRKSGESTQKAGQKKETDGGRDGRICRQPTDGNPNEVATQQINNQGSQRHHRPNRIEPIRHRPA